MRDDAAVFWCENGSDIIPQPNPLVTLFVMMEKVKNTNSFRYTARSQKAVVILDGLKEMFS